MLHLDEVFSAEIYARDTIVVGRPHRVEGSRETMGFTRRFFWYFSFADERKVRTFLVNNPSVSLAADSSLYTREPLAWCIS